MIDMLSSPLMQRSLIAALLVGASAPIVGTYLVQRRLALLGDGIGHISLTGVAAGWLVGAFVGIAEPESFALPGALIVAVAGSVGIEWVRSKGRVTGDVAMAILFYGGIAGGVVLIHIAGGTSANLMTYLFGSIATVSTTDVWWTAALVLLVLVVGLGLLPTFFAISHDEDFARASGIPAQWYSSLLAAMAAIMVTTAMRVVGLLLVSALMIVPVAAAQVFSRSFIATMASASAIGATVSVAGLTITYFYDLPPGAIIVVLAIAVYAVALAINTGRHRRLSPDNAHPNIPDDVVVGTSPARFRADWHDSYAE